MMRNSIERPEPSSGHPLVVFVVLLCIVSGLTSLVAEAAPESLQASLPRWGVVGWSLSLVAGGILILNGLLLQAVNGRLLIGVLFEYVGMASMGSAAILYASAVFAAVRWDGTYPAAITLGFGVACLYRSLTLHRVLKRAERRARQRGVATDGDR